MVRSRSVAHLGTSGLHTMDRFGRIALGVEQSIRSELLGLGTDVMLIIRCGSRNYSTNVILGWHQKTEDPIRQLPLRLCLPNRKNLNEHDHARSTGKMARDSPQGVVRAKPVLRTTGSSDELYISGDRADD